MTITDIGELTIVVDETHEDRICDRRSKGCPNAAVVRVRWDSCVHESPGIRDYCLPHWDQFVGAGRRFGRSAPVCAPPPCRCHIEALTYCPVPR